MLHIGRARHPGPGPRDIILGQLSIEFINVGGWLTSGDLAMDSCAQFLAVAEHRLIRPGLGLAVIDFAWLVIILFGLLPVRIKLLVVMLGLWCSPLSPIICHSSVPGVFQVGSGIENHSSYFSRRSGSPLCCLWVSGGGGGC